MKCRTYRIYNFKNGIIVFFIFVKNVKLIVHFHQKGVDLTFIIQ